MKFNENYKERFIKNINLFLKEKGWSRNKFAKELGTESSTVSKWLNGSTEPGLEYVIKIVCVLDCSIEELVN